MKKTMKAAKTRNRITVAMLTVCIVMMGLLVRGVDVHAAGTVTFYNMNRDLIAKVPSGEKSSAESGCVICCTAMILNTMGLSESTPYDIWVLNGRKPYVNPWSRIENNYNVTRTKTDLPYKADVGKHSDEKYRAIYALCQQNPQGVMVGGYMKNGQEHSVVAYINSNNELCINDPAGPSNDYQNGKIIGKNAWNYDDYSTFTCVTTFTYRGGSGTAPVVFGSVSSKNVTETSAVIEVQYSYANVSQLSKTGADWSWTGGSGNISFDVGNKLTYTNVAFDGAEGPKLRPGTTYTYRFWVLTKDNKYYYTDYYTFTTAACTHAYTSSTKAATCTAAGATTYTCSKCGYSYSTAIAALGHNYTSKVVAPTTTAQGYTLHTCTRCGDSYKDNYTAVLARNGWVTENGKKYYYVNNVKATGWQKIGGQTYYFSKSSDSLGQMLTGWRTIDGKRYYFSKSSGSQGQMLMGWRTIDGQRYYFSKSSGSQGQMLTGWRTIDGRRYYFSKSPSTMGRMLTGWQTVDGQRYYFSKATSAMGRMMTGWQTVDGQRYYFSAYPTKLGRMMTGWQTINGKRYYFSTYPTKLGRMVTGWQTIDGKRYYFDKNGVLQ